VTTLIVLGVLQLIVLLAVFGRLGDLIAALKERQRW